MGNGGVLISRSPWPPSNRRVTPLPPRPYTLPTTRRGPGGDGVALRDGWAEETRATRASEDDAALAVRALVDRAAFGTLYDRYVDRVYGYCHRRLQTPAAAQDATSQTFLKALAALASYRAEAGGFRAWLFTIASRVVIDAYRSGGRATTSLDDAVELRSPGTGPEELALVAETRREVSALVGRLPDEQAHIVQLRLAGLTDREIAAVLGKSHGAVRVAQHRAIQRLRGLAAAGDLANLDPSGDSTTETDR